jgi:hypothetical protein
LRTFTSLNRVDAVVTDFAAVLKKKPEDMRNRVAAASSDISARTLPTVGGSMPGSVSERMRDLEQLAEDVRQRGRDAQWGPVVQHVLEPLRRKKRR